MKPILGPMTLDEPEFEPRTHTSPELSFCLPTMQDNNVVLPHPEAPNSP